VTRSVRRRRGLRAGGVVALLTVTPTTASAHGVGHEGGAGATLLVVFGLPVLAGLAGGGVALRSLGGDNRTGGRRRPDIPIGLLLVGLGLASLLAAASGHGLGTLAGGFVGALLALRLADAGRNVADGCGNHADIALGAVAAHRVFEGVLVGALYSAGAAVGLLGAAIIAGHTALETAAVGGLYASGTRRTRGPAAVVLVQAGYLVGGVAGLGVARAVPGPVAALVLAGAGGALLVVGAGETRRSLGARTPAVAD